ncbi:MAG: GerMN domain-containing protein, partial [Firmicutes bacterium]|nr:GerMN domain-containing protein [Bacillota bacterium]
ELAERLPAGDEARLLAVSSLVNTLTQFDTVEKVRILVDGEPLTGSVAGVDLAAALAPADL